MTWTAFPQSRQTSAMVTINSYGAKRRKLVYRGAAAQRDENGKWARQETWVHCGHNHLKREMADQCARRLARELEKEDREKEAEITAGFSRTQETRPSGVERRKRDE